MNGDPDMHNIQHMQSCFVSYPNTAGQSIVMVIVTSTNK